jgi:hypothetical protein
MRLAAFAVIAVGVAPATALAYSTGFRFSIHQDATANISALADATAPVTHHMDVVRGGAVIASSPSSGSSYATLDLANLLPGDIARFYDGSAVRAIASYDGLPAISADACAGRQAFTATRSADHVVYRAGAYTPSSGYGVDNRAIFTSGNPFTVTLTRPLAAGDIAYAVTQGLQSSGNVGVEFQRYVNVGACPPVLAPSGAVPVSSKAPTDAEVLAKLKSSLAAMASRLKAQKTTRLARRKSVALPFAFSEPGTLRLVLRASAGKSVKVVTVGTGAKTATAAGNATVILKLTSAGRKLFRRARKLALTLKGTFQPSRAAAKAQTATARIALKRK